MHKFQNIFARLRVNTRVFAALLAPFGLGALAHAAPPIYCGSDINCLRWVDSQSQSQTPVQFAPFSLPSHLSVADVSSRTIPGLAPHERLCPTKCPVNVHNPNGEEVLGCYKICTPLAQTYVTRPPAYRPAPQPVYLRVVRPIIYVRYPVQYTPPASYCARPWCGVSRYGY